MNLTDTEILLLAQYGFPLVVAIYHQSTRAEAIEGLNSVEDVL